MTYITIYEKEGLISGFIMEGHSGYAESGSDIVCAALSALAITAANSLEQVLKLKPIIDTQESYMSVFLPIDLNQADRDRANLVLKTIRLGFSSIREEYPNNVAIKSSSNIHKKIR